MSFLLILCAIILSVVLYYYIYLSIIQGQHAAYPTEKNVNLANGKRKVICVGDSNTRGNVSYDWVASLQKKFPETCFFNAGINGDLTFSLKKRWDEIIQAQPDFVNILIGTNDIQAIASDNKLKMYRDLDKIAKDEHPDMHHFKDNLLYLIGRLKKETHAKIAIMSLPLITEDLSAQSNQIADKYSHLIAQIAEDSEITYLPLREKQKNYFFSHTPHTPNKYTYKHTNFLIYRAYMYHYFLGKSWADISKNNGFYLLTDNLHQNEISGNMIAELLEEWLMKSN